MVMKIALGLFSFCSTLRKRASSQTRVNASNGYILFARGRSLDFARNRPLIDEQRLRDASPQVVVSMTDVRRARLRYFSVQPGDASKGINLRLRVMKSL